MKKFLVPILFLVVLMGCGHTPVEPVNDQIQIKKANITVNFDFATETITVTNGNDLYVNVWIGRWNSDVNDYLRIFEAWMWRYGTETREAKFKHGDTIKLKIQLEGQQTPVIEFYELG